MTIFLFRLMFVLLELFCVMYPLVRWLTLFVISRGIEMLAIIIIIISGKISLNSSRSTEQMVQFFRAEIY